MVRPNTLALVVSLFAASWLVGCNQHSASEAPASTSAPVATPEPEPPPPSPASKARKLFDTKCIVCHGNHGAGDGPGAAALSPKPRAFADATWQASVTDDQIKKTIVEGGAAVGKSAAMSANPELANEPEELTALVKIVRDFKQ